MDVDNGHLVTPETLDAMSEQDRANYEPVPDHLSQASMLELMGQGETYVGANASGSMSKHMRAKRKKKSQMAKASRRKNRCHQS